MISKEEIQSAFQSAYNSVPRNIVTSEYEFETEEIRQFHAMLLRDYNTFMLENGIAIDKKSMDKMDSLDMRNVFKKVPALLPGDNEKYSFPAFWSEEFLKAFGNLKGIEKENIEGQSVFGFSNVKFLDCIPCFKEGFLQVADRLWLVFRVIDIQLEESKQCTIEISEYGQHHNVGGFGLHTQVTLLISEINGKIEFEVQDAMTLPEIYELLLEEIPWDKEIKNYFYYTILKNYKASDQAKTDMLNEVYAFKHGLNVNGSITPIVQTFIPSIMYTNQLLENETIEKIKAEKNPIKKLFKVKSTYSTEIIEKKRIIKTIGPQNVIINSKADARKPTEEIIRHYTVASWSVRGHVRHYKSGKTVYIKPHEKHRKDMTKTEEEIRVPKTIKVK